jgi:hypothetical protein
MLEVQNSKQEIRSLSHRFTEAVMRQTYGLMDYTAYISLRKKGTTAKTLGTQQTLCV